jgi:hypothetical protein
MNFDRAMRLAVLSVSMAISSMDAATGKIPTVALNIKDAELPGGSSRTKSSSRRTHRFVGRW